MMFLKMLPLVLIFASCISEVVPESCDELSMQIFKGAPLSRQKFEQKCQNVKIRYTQILCHAALTELMKTNDLILVKKKFGDPVEKCFTSNDLRTFSPK